MTRRVRKKTAQSGGVSVRAISSKVKRADLSRQIEDPEVQITVGDLVIPTPYNMSTLSSTYESSNMLKQCVAAMVVNTTSYGFRTVPINDTITPDPNEQSLLDSFIESPNIEQSLIGLKKKENADYETYGFSFLEIVRDRSKKVSMLKYCPAYFTRIMKKDKTPIPVTVEIARGGKRTKVTEHKRFRRYVQQIGATKVYFKEFGDPRIMDYTNGEYQTDEYKVPKENIATEILHRGQHSENAYGLPRWISQLPSVLGSREAEEVNLRYFEDNTVPPMMLMVSGGRLTKDSFNVLQDILNSKGLGRDRQNQVILVEAVPETTGLDDKGTVKLDVEKLTDARQSDGLFKEYDESNMAKIRSAFRLPPVAVGLSQDVTFACYDERTETLTDQGWVSVDQWQEGMKVACYDKDTGAIAFHEPENGILVYDVADVEMYRIQSAQQDMLITPNHRMLTATKKDGKYVVERIEEVANRSRSYFKTSGLYSKGLEYDMVDYFSVPASEYKGGIAAKDEEIVSIPSRLLMEWLGYFIADGCITQRGCAIQIGAKKERKVSAFASLHEELEEQGFRIRVSEESAGTYYTVSHKGMAQLFAEIAGDCSERKNIPDIAFRYSSSDLQILFDAMMFCDGHLDTREGRTSGAYSTVSVALADSFQRLAVLLGYRTLLRKDRPGQYGVNPVYRILLSRKETCQILTDRHISREKYTGRVYCFSVPTGVFITRRNGKVAFQGNTANVSAYLAETQVYLPERISQDEVLNKGIINHPNGLGLKTVKLESKGPSITNPDQIVKTLTAANAMGGVTPRTAISVLNETMQLNLVQYPEPGSEGYEDWMDKPISIGMRESMSNTQQTGEGDTTHEEQSGKTQDIKDREKNGETGIGENAVEHGEE